MLSLFKTTTDSKIESTCETNQCNMFAVCTWLTVLIHTHREECIVIYNQHGHRRDFNMHFTSFQQHNIWVFRFHMHVLSLIYSHMQHILHVCICYKINVAALHPQAHKPTPNATFHSQRIQPLSVMNVNKLTVEREYRSTSNQSDSHRLCGCLIICFIDRMLFAFLYILHTPENRREPTATVFF